MIASWARPSRVWSVVLVGSSLVACRKSPDPLGVHRGACTVSHRPLGVASAKTPGSEPCSDSFSVFREGDAYKVDLGDCTIHLGASAGDDGWKISGPAPCTTKQGPARITEGKLYRSGDAFNLSFDGSTEDKKLGVAWGFSTDPARK